MIKQIWEQRNWPLNSNKYIMQAIPKSGLKGLAENWQSDLLAAVSVALVALPLSLGIAIASGVPPMAGVISAVIGGVVTTFFRGSHLTINGPTAGLIAVILSSVAALNDGSGNALNYVFAAIVIAGAIQTVMGLLRMGRFANLFHSTVIHGILAAIGVIIIAKQIHIAMGTTSAASDIFGTLFDAVKQIPNINPFVGIISILGLLLLVFQSRISYKLFHLIPAPLWLLIFSVPFVWLFGFFDSHSIEFLGKSYEVGPELLINIPSNPLDAIMFPNFSKINTGPFWLSVISITMIGSIESLAGTKAVDKLDPYNRKSDLNKDLLGVGLSTMVSGAIGGLPIIAVIVRSSVNVHNNAKTKWSNFFHGVLMLLFVFIFTPFIQMVPQCALAILLVYTGFKLTSPKVFRDVFSKGPEQFIFFVATLVITLMSNLLIGIFAGLLLVLLIHWLLSMMPIQEYFKGIFDSGSHVFTNKDGSYNMKIKGIANFLATLKIEALLERIQPGSKVTIDLSEAKLVDHSILEHLYDFQRSHIESGGTVIIAGIDKHASSSGHKMALKILPKSMSTRLSKRQTRLTEMASGNNWNFNPSFSDEFFYIEQFDFFKTRPIEERLNTVTSADENDRWEICDVTFDEGAYEADDEYHTTLCMVNSSEPIPRFVIERKTFTDRYLDTSWHKDIDYHLYRNFSKDFIVKEEVKGSMEKFLNPELRKFIEGDEIHHLESNGEAIMIFRDDIRLAQISDYSELVCSAIELQELV
ncbi:SulP family inorganic anion transporter [Chitinophagales bacterium]|nr:SulP family inorganic anion transporter [Chitinophagales bacterium]